MAEEGAPQPKVYVAGLGGLPQMATSIQQAQYYHYGWAGRLAATTNGAGDITGSYRYTAYGVPTYFGVADEVGNVSEPERLLFNGQPWFGQLGLYRLVNRWYSPHQASFITPDPLGLIDDPNRYSYGRNHPLMWIDPLGLAAEGPFAGFKRAALMVGGYAWQAVRTAAHDPLIAPWLGPFGWTAWFVVPAPDDSFISDATLGERMNPLNQIYAGFTAAANEPDPFKAGAHAFNGARGTGAIIELLAGVPCRWPTTPQEAPYPWQTKQVAHYHLPTTPQKVHYPSRMMPREQRSSPRRWRPVLNSLDELVEKFGAEPRTGRRRKPGIPPGMNFTTTNIPVSGG